MQYRLRTLLIALALAPPLIAAIWWIARDERRRNTAFEVARAMPEILGVLLGLLVFALIIGGFFAVIATVFMGKR